MPYTCDSPFGSGCATVEVSTISKPVMRQNRPSRVGLVRALPQKTPLRFRGLERPYLFYILLLILHRGIPILFNKISMNPSQPTIKKTPEQISEEIARLSKMLISLEEQIGRTHFESGSDTSDDAGQEAVLDNQASDLLVFEINSIREKITDLEEQLTTMKDKKAA